MSTVKIAKVIFIICTILLIITLSLGCQHIIQLPQPVELEQGTKKAEMLKTFDEITNMLTEEKSLNILFVTGSEAEGAKSIVDEFEASHDIKVNIFETNIKHIKEIITSSGTSSGVGILDIAVFPPYYDGSIDNYMMTLDRFIEEDGLDSEDYIDLIYKKSGEWEGSIIGIPVMTSIFGIVYRKDLFEEMGVPVKDDWTYDEYQEYLEALNTGGIYGVSFNTSQSSLNYYWSNRFWTLGGKTTTEDWEITVNNDIGYKSIELFKDLKNYSQEGILDMPYNEILSDFIAGKSAVMEGSLDFLFSEEFINSPVYNEIGLLPTPTGPAGNCVQLESLIIGILEKSEKKEISWEWIKYYTSENMQARMLDEFGVMSPRISTYDNEELNKKYIFLDNIYSLLEVSEIKSRWKIRASYEAWEIDLSNILNEVINEDIVIEEALIELEKEWEKVLVFKPPDIGNKNFE